MPIPALTAKGLLPQGIHTATLEEIEQMFGVSTDVRVRLFGNLRRYHDLVKGMNLFSALYVDGSFVTDKREPNDIDVAIEFLATKMTLVQMHPGVARVLDRGRVMRDYELHVFPQAAPQTTWSTFFQQLYPEEALVRKVPKTHRKGILKVDL